MFRRPQHLLFAVLGCYQVATVSSSLPFVNLWVRGGASTKKESSRTTLTTKDPFPSVAHFLSQRLQKTSSEKNHNKGSKSKKDPSQRISAIVQALRTLSLAQQAFKGLDGAAHEAYQRGGNSKNKNVVTTSVRGRAQRSAQRTSATATALEACELCELLETTTVIHGKSTTAATASALNSSNTTDQSTITTWAQERGYQMLFYSADASELRINTTATTTTSSTQLSVLVLYDPCYRGGAGAGHASIEDLHAPFVNEATTTSPTNTSSLLQGELSPRGKLIIIIGNVNDNLIQLLQVLDQPPLSINSTAVARQSASTPQNTAAATISVQPRLYQTAAQLLQLLQPILQQQQQQRLQPKESNTKSLNQTNSSTLSPKQYQHQPIAIHFVGRSLAGGVATLAAALLDGSLPLPKQHPGTRNSVKSSSLAVTKDSSAVADLNNNSFLTTLEGWGRGRCSATVLGCPPCSSPNVPLPFVTSILLGDDIACRSSFASLERLTARVARHAAGQDSWWHKVAQPTAAFTDALSMTVSSLKSAAMANDHDRLVVPGRAYLIRPRRLGGVAGSSSIHEVALGSHVHHTSRREALRAAVLWQLDDIMLSNSLWKHHNLESYIHGLDRVQLRSVDDNEFGNDEKQ